MFEKIVVPIDPGEVEFSASALAAAARLAAGSNGVIRIVAVMAEMNAYITEFLPADFETGLAADTEKRVRAIAEAAGIPADRLSVVMRSGSIYHEVIDEAAEWGADSIVVSSHRPQMSTYLLGSNAAKIVRHAPCSVLVVRD